MDHDDKGHAILALGWTLVGITTVIGGLRIYCKFFKIGKPWWDDLLIVVSWVCLVTTVCLNTASVSRGFGKHAWDIPVQNFSYLALVGDISATSSILAAAWSKTSFAVTLLKFMSGWMRGFIWFIIISINIFMGASALFPWFQCSPSAKGWNPQIPGTCWAPEVNVYYGIFAASYSAVMSISLSFLPLPLIRSLQLPRREKIGVALAMSCGIFAGVTAIAKTSCIPSLKDPDFSYWGYRLVMWSIAEGSATIIAASIPVLRVMVRDVRKRSALPGSDASGSGHKGGAESKGESKVESRPGRSRSVVTISAIAEPPSPGTSRRDDRSDKSILGGAGRQGRGIVQTNEVMVESYERDDRDGDATEAYELRGV